jgi:hypothetical protein
VGMHDEHSVIGRPASSVDQRLEGRINQQTSYQYSKRGATMKAQYLALRKVRSGAHLGT